MFNYDKILELKEIELKRLDEETLINWNILNLGKDEEGLEHWIYIEVWTNQNNQIKILEQDDSNVRDITNELTEAQKNHIYKLIETSLKNVFLKAYYNGKEFWSGSVNLLDGIIEETHTYEEAKEADFHHSLYFSESAVEKIKNEECTFFWIENSKVYGEWRDELDDNMITKIKEQIIIK